MSCINKQWRWRAVSEQLMSPAYVLAALIGVILIVAGWWVPAAASVVSSVTGVGLVVLFAVNPLLSAASLGEGGFDFKLSNEVRDQRTTAEFAIHEDLLVLTAAELSGEADVRVYVEGAMKEIHRAAFLVPHNRRKRYLLCSLVDVIGSRTALPRMRSGVDAPGLKPHPDGQPIDLSFTAHCAVVLSTVGHLKDPEIAEILDVDLPTARELIKEGTAAIALTSRPVET